MDNDGSLTLWHDRWWMLFIPNEDFKSYRGDQFAKNKK